MHDAEPEPTPETPAAPAAPAFVPADEFKQTVAMLTGQLQQLATMVQAIGRPQPAEPAADPEITDQQLDEAIIQGRNASGLIRKLAASSASRELSELRSQVKALRDTGLKAVSNVTRTQALAGLAHAQRFGKEIDEMMVNASPEVLTNPDAWRNAYAMIVGSHHDELVREAREAALRGPDNEPPGAPSGRSGRSTTSSKTPSVEELLGDDAAQALRARGRTPDEHARSQGFPSWSEYAKWVQESMA